MLPNLPGIPSLCLVLAAVAVVVIGQRATARQQCENRKSSHVIRLGGRASCRVVESYAWCIIRAFQHANVTGGGVRRYLEKSVDKYNRKSGLKCDLNLGCIDTETFIVSNDTVTTIVNNATLDTIGHHDTKMHDFCRCQATGSRNESCDRLRYFAMCTLHAIDFTQKKGLTQTQIKQLQHRLDVMERDLNGSCNFSLESLLKEFENRNKKTEGDSRQLAVYIATGVASLIMLNVIVFVVLRRCSSSPRPTMADEGVGAPHCGSWLNYNRYHEDDYYFGDGDPTIPPHLRQSPPVCVPGSGGVTPVAPPSYASDPPAYDDIVPGRRESSQEFSKDNITNRAPTSTLNTESDSPFCNDRNNDKDTKNVTQT